jgi:hypothetical protein
LLVATTKLNDMGWVKKENTASLLAEFVNLSGADNNKYLKFARKWGPLWDERE